MEDGNYTFAALPICKCLDRRENSPNSGAYCEPDSASRRVPAVKSFINRLLGLFGQMS